MITKKLSATPGLGNHGVAWTTLPPGVCWAFDIASRIGWRIRRIGKVSRRVSDCLAEIALEQPRG